MTVIIIFCLKNNIYKTTNKLTQQNSIQNRILTRIINQQLLFLYYNLNKFFVKSHLIFKTFSLSANYIILVSTYQFGMIRFSFKIQLFSVIFRESLSIVRGRNILHSDIMTYRIFCIQHGILRNLSLFQHIITSVQFLLISFQKPEFLFHVIFYERYRNVTGNGKL